MLIFTSFLLALEIRVNNALYSHRTIHNAIYRLAHLRNCSNTRSSSQTEKFVGRALLRLFPFVIVAAQCYSLPRGFILRHDLSHADWQSAGSHSFLILLVIRTPATDRHLDIGHSRGQWAVGQLQAPPGPLFRRRQVRQCW